MDTGLKERKAIIFKFQRLLDVPDAEMAAGKGACALVQFVEYSSQQWFIAGNNLPALKDKVTSH